MILDRINAYRARLPFSDAFPHSLNREGAFAESVIVEIQADKGGLIGYGEGAPRSYVTGETPAGVLKSLGRFLRQDLFPWTLKHVDQIWDFVDSLPEGREENAALCALEMALLDLLGRKQGRNLTEYFSKDFFGADVTYGAALPLSNPDRIRKACRTARDMDIFRLKLKMGPDANQNRENLAAIGEVFADQCDLKVDVNGAWDAPLAAAHVPLIRDFRVRVVEQPMMPRDPHMADFSKEMRSLNVMTMADESACTLKEAKLAVERGHYHMINVRLSKCGGFRRSLAIIDWLRREKIPFQIACQLGESGLLSAAGRALSLLCSDALYHDGSYDEFLLKENLTTENVSFGREGKAGPLSGHGLGVEVDPRSLLRLSAGNAPLSFTGS